MLSDKEIVCPDNLLNVAHKKKGVTAGIVNAGKPLPMISAMDAVNENLIEPIFIGHEVEIHQMRVITLDDKTPVSPEGVHQDGYDFIAIIGIERYNISGGQAFVHRTYGGKAIFESSLKSGEMLMINDKKLWHNANGIFRMHPDMQGYMDAFILTARH